MIIIKPTNTQTMERGFSKERNLLVPVFTFTTQERLGELGPIKSAMSPCATLTSSPAGFQSNPLGGRLVTHDIHLVCSWKFFATDFSGSHGLRLENKKSVVHLIHTFQREKSIEVNRTFLQRQQGRELRRKGEKNMLESSPKVEGNQIQSPVEK